MNDLKLRAVRTEELRNDPGNARPHGERTAGAHFVGEFGDERAKTVRRIVTDGGFRRLRGESPPLREASGVHLSLRAHAGPRRLMTTGSPLSP